jgi:predicted lipid-binding transport protein (Tim44 family)
MNNKPRYLIWMFFTLALGLLYFFNETAEARRMGGGRSFGSRPSYQRSAPAPAKSPSSTQTQPGQTGQQPGTPRAPLGGLGGMMGGLLAGGLIGSLLFGGGHGAGGPGLLDLLLIGGGLFFLFRFLKNRQLATAGNGPVGAMPFQGFLNPSSSGNMGFPSFEGENPAGLEQPSLPSGLDPEEFLKGARAVYTRLQSSWDKRDLHDIRQFTSDEVFHEIEQQAREDSKPGKTELLMINPRILEAREVGDQTIFSVLYDVMMREDQDPLSKQVRELWHFSRSRESAGSSWILEGIQQVE